MSSYLKTKAYRNPQLLKLAKDAPCSICCSYGTTVSAHSNLLEHGKGMGRKASDAAICFLCYNCHSKLDQGQDSYEDKRSKFFEACTSTYIWLMDNGYLEVKSPSKVQKVSEPF